VRRNIYKINVLIWLAALLFVFGCEKEAKKLLRIKVGSNAIYVAEKEIAKTAAVAKQDTLMIEALYTLLLSNKKEAEKALVLVQIIESHISYSVLFKIITTIEALGFTDVNITSKINRKDYTEIISPPERAEFGGNRLKLTVAIFKDYFEISAGGSSLHKIAVVNPIDFTYEELAVTLAEVRNRFADSPDIDKIIILGEDDTKISNIIQVMHIAGTIGFNKKNLFRFVTPVQITEEDSIRRADEFKATQRKMDSLFNLGLDTSSLAKLFVENKVVPDFRDTNIALSYAKYLIREKIQSEKRDSMVKEYIRKRREMPIVDVKPM
jgi:hypothetical protein